MSIDDFERYPLTFGPSPVHRLDRLTDHLGGAAVWAKREDCNSGLAFGGNKTRKLEYIVPDALASGADTLVSIGGYQSNHTRQVAAVAAKLGLKCRLVQEKWVNWDDPGNDKVGNILLSRIMGADVRLDPAGFDIGIRRSWEEALAEVEAAGGKPYAIPAGASEHNLGGLGFANWAYEVERQERELGALLRHHRGLHGHRLDPRRHDRRVRRPGAGPRRVIGIDASATLDKTRAQVERIARHTADLIGLGRELRDDEIKVLEGWAGDDYGIPVQSTVDAIRLCGELEGMIIDPVYEGKSMAGLIDLVRDGEIAQDSTRASTPTSAASRPSTRTAASSDPLSGPGQVLLDALHLGGQLPVVPGPDVGLQDQTDPRRDLRDDLDGALHDRHHLVPLPLHVGEHRVGLVGKAGLADDSDGGRHRVGHRTGLVAGHGRDAECHDHGATVRCRGDRLE